MSDEHRPERHFEIAVPVGSEPSVDSGDPECIRVTQPDQSVVTGLVDGKVLCLDEDNVHIKLENVDVVTVTDLALIEQHTISRVFNSTSHFIRFVGGGELRFAFSCAGDLLELSAECLSLQIAPDGKTLLFGPLAKVAQV